MSKELTEQEATLIAVMLLYFAFINNGPIDPSQNLQFF